MSEKKQNGVTTDFKGAGTSEGPYITADPCHFTDSLILSRLTDNPSNAVLDRVRAEIAAGKDIINMTQGEPMAAATLPKFYADALKEVIDQGSMTYGPAMNASLRQELSDYYNRFYEKDISPGRIFPVGSGSASIFLSTLGLLEPGSRVDLFVPAWRNIGNEMEAVGAKVVMHQMGYNEETGQYYIDREILENAITDESKLIYTNSPNNPTGSVLTLDQLQVINDFVRERNVTWFSDEVYDRMVYGDGERAPSALDIHNLSHNCLVFNSFSKLLGLTGTREGWVVGPKEAEPFFNALVTNSNLCPSPLQQNAIVLALRNGEDHIASQNKLYAENREVYAQWIEDNKDVITAGVPEGAFYGWAKVKGLNDSVPFCHHLIDNGVGVSPGEPFGPGCEGYIRLCFAKDTETFAEALDRTSKAVRSFVADPEYAQYLDAESALEGCELS